MRDIRYLFFKERATTYATTAFMLPPTPRHAVLLAKSARFALRYH